MTLREFYAVHGRKGLEAVADGAKTTAGSLIQIIYGRSGVSARLAERIAAASNGLMTEMELFYPERYGQLPRGAAGKKQSNPTN